VYVSTTRGVKRFAAPYESQQISVECAETLSADLEFRAFIRTADLSPEDVALSAASQSLSAGLSAVDDYVQVAATDGAVWIDYLSADVQISGSGEDEEPVAVGYALASREYDVQADVVRLDAGERKLYALSGGRVMVLSAFDESSEFQDVGVGPSYSDIAPQDGALYALRDGFVDKIEEVEDGAYRVTATFSDAPVGTIACADDFGLPFDDPQAVFDSDVQEYTLNMVQALAPGLFKGREFEPAMALAAGGGGVYGISPDDWYVQAFGPVSSGVELAAVDASSGQAYVLSGGGVF